VKKLRLRKTTLLSKFTKIMSQRKKLNLKLPKPKISSSKQLPPSQIEI
jgi:hypothetical protein